MFEEGSDAPKLTRVLILGFHREDIGDLGQCRSGITFDFGGVGDVLITPRPVITALLTATNSRTTSIKR